MVSISSIEGSLSSRVPREDLGYFADPLDRSGVTLNDEDLDPELENYIISRTIHEHEVAETGYQFIDLINL